MHIDILFELFISVLALVLTFWAIKHFYFLWYYGKKKEQINRLEARVAVLRMLLKTKLKRKGSALQDQYKDDKAFLDKIQSKLELLVTYNFQRNSDYSEVIEILSSISEMIDQQIHIKTPEIGKAATVQSEKLIKDFSHLPQASKWIQLLKYDKGNLFIIKEIVETVFKLKNKIEDYNRERQNREYKLRSVELIEIAAFDDLKVIVDSEFHKNHEGQAEDVRTDASVDSKIKSAS